MTNDQSNKLQEAMQEVDKGIGTAALNTRPRIFRAEENPDNILSYLKKITAAQVELLRELERIRRFLGME